MQTNKIHTLATAALGTLALALGLNLPIHQAQANEKVEFICAESFDQESGKSLPTTFAWTERGKIAVVRWESEVFSGSSFTPQKRCETASPNFQIAYENNTLGLITNGTKNNQRVICTSGEPGGECETVLLTLRPEDLRPEDRSLKILQQFRQIFNGEQVGPVKHSSAVPQVYYQVDVENFLNTAPVE